MHQQKKEQEGVVGSDLALDVQVGPALVLGRRTKLVTDAQIETLIVASFAAALSLLHMGFLFGIENNLFHLPIVAGLFDEPQYRDDAFIQSLRHFSSGVWLLLSNSEKHLGHTYLLFFALTYLSRLLSFLGFLSCASLVGIVNRRDKIVFSLIVCFTAFLNGDSFAGDGGLFVNYFTHSEIANGTILLAIYFAASSRYAAATAWAGATFFINAFMAVWLLPLLVFIAATALAGRKTTAGTIFAEILAGLGPCLILAAPVLINIASNPEFGKPLDFDFINYLHQYFGRHVLIDTIPAAGISALAAVTLLGSCALYWLGPEAGALRAAYCGAIAVYCIGIVAPFVTSSPLILNLHLLRSSVLIHFLAGLATAALATKWLRDDAKSLFLLGCLTVLLLSSENPALLPCIPLLISGPVVQAMKRVQVASTRTAGRLLVLIIAVLVWPLSVRQNLEFAQVFADSISEWTAVGNWARNATPATAVFLLTPQLEPGAPGESASDLALSRISNFEFVSRRRIWIDYKRGAAAMWSPSYYHIWRARLSEFDLSDSVDQRIAAAGRLGIDYVIERCRMTPADPVFRTARLCVFRTAHPDSGIAPGGIELRGALR